MKHLFGNLRLIFLGSVLAYGGIAIVGIRTGAGWRRGYRTASKAHVRCEEGGAWQVSVSSNHALSGDAAISCSTCHMIQRKGWTKNVALGEAYPGSKHFRNAPTLLNTAHKKKLGIPWHWDGRIATSLNDMSRDQITDTYVHEYGYANHAGEAQADSGCIPQDVHGCIWQGAIQRPCQKSVCRNL